MADPNTYKVKIEGDGLALEREVANEIGEQIVVLILSGTARPTPLATNVSSPPIETGQTGTLGATPSHLSVREFLDEHNAKRNPDIIAAVGVYLRSHNKQQTFTKKDITAAFEDAAEPPPQNSSRDFKWAVRVGWIAKKQGAKDTFYVTSSGTKAVESKFPSDLLKRTRLTTRPKKASARKKMGNDT